jgi:hypothetical protein
MYQVAGLQANYPQIAQALKNQEKTPANAGAEESKLISQGNMMSLGWWG